MSNRVNSSIELDEYERKLLEGWEEIYKRGLLTMWLLLATRDQPRYATEIAEFVECHTNGSMSVDDRSLYRALRRLKSLHLLEESARPGERSGAPRKYYQLTLSGEKILATFLDQNIRSVYITGNETLFR